MTISGLSSRTQCGDLGFCHYERSEVIQKSSVACEEIASTTPQVWLVAGLHLGFAKKIFSLHRNDNFRVVIANAVWRSVGDEIASAFQVSQ